MEIVESGSLLPLKKIVPLVFSVIELVGELDRRRNQEGNGRKKNRYRLDAEKS